ncbi:sucrase ferredoxin [Saccharothrix sp. MB29]|nr:sucrase ferredoxin [Saccharothrix sp. MB29]
MTEPRCAAISATLDDPRRAPPPPPRRGWPWSNPALGRDALTQSRLDPAIGAELARRAADAGCASCSSAGPAATPTPRAAPGLPRHHHPGASRLRAGHVVDPAGLLDLDLRALARGADTGFGSPAAPPVLLVCANSRRDTCCALLGRPLAGELAAERGEAVWECTHTGGHRFAPTGVLLPTGYTYGRLDAGFARLLLDRAAAGHVVTDRCRGRSTHGPAGQVADLAVRELTGEHRDTLAVVGETAHGVTVRHDDGRAWHVAVTTASYPPVPSAAARPHRAHRGLGHRRAPLVPAGD